MHPVVFLYRSRRQACDISEWNMTSNLLQWAFRFVPSRSMEIWHYTSLARVRILGVPWRIVDRHETPIVNREDMKRSAKSGLKKTIVNDLLLSTELFTSKRVSLFSEVFFILIMISDKSIRPRSAEKQKTETYLYYNFIRHQGEHRHMRVQWTGVLGSEFFAWLYGVKRAQSLSWISHCNRCTRHHELTSCSSLVSCRAL